MKNVEMTEALWRYVVETGTRESDVQRRLSELTAGHPRAGMQIGPDQGQFMALLVRLLGVRWALEIGTFTGYSALSVAMALPEDGRLVACDISDEFTRVGRPFWEEAGVADRIELRLGPAAATLEALLAEGGEDAFDFAFIDADKGGYDGYYEQCLRLVRPGGVIAVDNVLWHGRVVDAADRSADTLAVRALNAKIHEDERVEMCLLPISDGLTLARRR